MKTVSNVFSHLVDATQKHKPRIHSLYLIVKGYDDGMIASSDLEIAEFLEEAKKANMTNEEISASIMDAIIENERYMWEDVLSPMFDAIHKDLSEIWRRQDGLEELVQKETE